MNNYHLTDREKEVLKLVVQGYKDQVIGDKLGYSRGTIKNCLSSIYIKFGLWDSGLNKRVVVATKYAENGYREL